MNRDQEWVGLNSFIWFFGIVEDINDPLNIGRVRVRCHGWHTENKEDLPPQDLPWAQVMMPVTSASHHGVGQSPTGLLVGSSVVGFFMDGQQTQQPMVIGSFPGIPMRRVLPDTPNLAYHNWNTDPITAAKDSTNIQDVPKAALFKMSTAEDRNYAVYAQEGENRDSLTWDEPAQRGGRNSTYPSNHVWQTKSGHAFEVDDSNGCERIHEYHRTGTFYEIQPDGSRVTKIVNDDYEVVANEKNVLIKGDCNITINGTCRMLFANNLIQEVKGDYCLTVHGDMLTKVIKNEAKDVHGNRSYQINGDAFERISGNDTLVVAKDQSINVNKEQKITVGGNKQETVMGDNDKTTVGGDTEVIIGNKVIGTAGNFEASAAADVKVTAQTNFYRKVVGESHIRFEGDKHEHIGADSYLRNDSGTDYTCSTDPARSGSNDCSDVESP